MSGGNFLHLFDTKQLLYTGIMKQETITNGVVQSEGEYKDRYISVGPITYALSFLYNFIGKGDIVFCHDSVPRIKRELMEELYPGRLYKGNRNSHSQDVDINMCFKFFKRMLEELGVTCIEVDSYEADDLIDSMVHKYKNDYDHIYVHSRDSDQFHLVDSKVSVMAITANGRDITMNSYVKACKKGVDTPYNSVNFYKIIEGDEKHNNIPNLSKAIRNTIRENIPQSSLKYLGDNNLLKLLVRNAVQGNELVCGTVDLILPLEVPYDYLTTEQSEINWKLFKYWLYEFQVSSFMQQKRFAGDYSSESDPTGQGRSLIEDMFREGGV